MKIYNKLAGRDKRVLPLNSSLLGPTFDLVGNKVKVGTASIATLKGTAPQAIDNLNPSNKQQNSIQTFPLGLGMSMKEGNYYTLNLNNRRKYLKGFLGQGHSPALNSNAILHQNTKAVVYSFNKVNNLSPLLTKTEYLLKSVFRSIFSLISKPIYLIKHDKVIIRLFVYLSPKIDKYLDTSTIGTRAASYPIGDTLGNSNLSIGRAVAGFAANINRFKIGKYLKFKSLRPNVIEILKSQIQYFGKQESSSLLLLLKSRLIREENSILESKCFDPIIEAEAKKNNHLIKGQQSKKEQQSIPATKGEVRGSYNNYYIANGINVQDSRYIEPADTGKVFGASAPESINQSGINKFPYVSLVSNFKFKLEKLCLVFEKIFNKKVEFEIIKAQLPFQDSNILAQVLGYNANNYKFRRMLKILIPRAVIKNPSKVYLRGPAEQHEELQVKKEQSISYLSGMNIKLAGRLMTQSIRPRFTVQSLQEGSLARVKVHYIEKSRFTGKNKRGAFSFTVTISHVFN